MLNDLEVSLIGSVADILQGMVDNIFVLYGKTTEVKLEGNNIVFGGVTAAAVETVIKRSISAGVFKVS